MSIFPTEQLTAMRATVDSTLTDACTIGTPGADTFNTTTGIYSHGAEVAVYAGPCRFGPTEGTDRVAEVGGEAVSLRTYKVRLPWDTEGVAVEQILVATASNDPHLVDREFRVIDVRGLTDPLSRSITVEDRLG